MNREITFHGKYFIDFYKELDIGIKSKFKHVFELIGQVEMIPKKFLVQMIRYKGLFEKRVENLSNICSVICCSDKEKLTVLFNGLQKKIQKTTRKEVEKAMRLIICR